MDITKILLAAQSPDRNLRSVAECNLKLFQEQNLPNFLLSLSVELSSDERPPESRTLAGIILKDSLDSKDSAKKELLIQQWVNLDQFIKLEIKESLLIILGSPVAGARQISSQVIAKVASIEIPRAEWQGLIADLLGNMTQQGASAPLKQATLETLMYVCDEIPPQHLEQDEVDYVLTAVFQGMNQAELSSEVRLAAVKALYKALDFAESSFANVMDRDRLMTAVCDTAVSKEVEIRQAAFGCLVAIASKYYMHLKPYMQTILSLTAKAAKGDEESAALQAIEFWRTICICEVQIELREDYEAVNYHFIETTSPSLVPMLLETLLKQEEDQEQDGNLGNISTSDRECLSLIARTVADAIVPLVMPFVEANITEPDWHCRRAAIFALVSILEGPSVEELAPLVQAKLDCLLNTTVDLNSQAKGTTAWALGRVFERLHSPASANPIITCENLPRIINMLLESSKDVPNVSEKVCGAIYFLAQGYEDEESISSVLTPYLQSVIYALLSASDRADTTHLLRASAFKALNEIVTVSNIPENSKIIGELLHDIMKRLNATFDVKITSSGDRVKQNDLQALLCGVLQVIIQKLSNSAAYSIITNAANLLMLLFFRVLGCHSCSSTVREKAMLAIGALACATGQDFVNHMPMLLANYDEYQLSPISVGVMGEICHVLGDKVLEFCDEIMDVLHKGLSNPMLNRSVKPAIFSCFGDIALAIGENFEKYLPRVMERLQGCADLPSVLDRSDEDMVNYRDQIRQGIFKAYSGILQGLKGPKAGLMGPYAIHLMHFIEAMCKDRSRDDSVACTAVATLHVLQDTFASWIQETINKVASTHSLT